MPLHADAAAHILIAADAVHYPTDAVLTIALDWTPAPGGGFDSLRVGWSTPHKVERRRGWARMTSVAGIPLYVHPRLGRYLQWHDATLTTCRRLWRERLIVMDELDLLYELQRWEITHPRPGCGEARRAATPPHAYIL